DAEDELEREAQDVRHLRRRPDGELSAGTGPRHDRPRLHRVRDKTRLDVPPGDDDVGSFERGLEVVRLGLPDVALVRAQIRVDDRRAFLERLVDVRDGRELLVLDLDQLRSILREGTALGQDDRDAVALEACLARREREVRWNLDVLGDGPRAGKRAL